MRTGTTLYIDNSLFLPRRTFGSLLVLPGSPQMWIGFDFHVGIVVTEFKIDNACQLVRAVFVAAIIFQDFIVRAVQQHILR